MFKIKHEPFHFRLMNLISRMVYLYILSKDIPIYVLKEMNLKQLLEQARWTHWLLHQKETEKWIEDTEWGDIGEIRFIVSGIWRNFSPFSKKWIKEICTRG